MRVLDDFDLDGSDTDDFSGPFGLNSFDLEDNGSDLATTRTSTSIPARVIWRSGTYPYHMAIDRRRSRSIPSHLRTGRYKLYQILLPYQSGGRTRYRPIYVGKTSTVSRRPSKQGVIHRLRDHRDRINDAVRQGLLTRTDARRLVVRVGDVLHPSGQTMHQHVGNADAQSKRHKHADGLTNSLEKLYITLRNPLLNRSRQTFDDFVEFEDSADFDAFDDKVVRPRLPFSARRRHLTTRCRRCGTVPKY